VEVEIVADAPQPTPFDDAFLTLKHGGTELYFIRHADALPDADEVVLGHYDEQSLSELGRRQAQALAERMRELPLVAIYSAPLGRARQTAAPVAAAHGLEVRIEPGLREVELGPLHPELSTAATPAEFAEALRARLREVAAIAVGSGSWAGIPGAEPSDQLRPRILGAVGRIAAEHRGQRVAIVSHAGTINVFFAASLGIANDYFFPAMNTSISVARVKGPRTLVMALNDVAHLHAAGLIPPPSKER
jgi:broad specificity phosphatase PhoE